MKKQNNISDRKRTYTLNDHIILPNVSWMLPSNEMSTTKTTFHILYPSVLQCVFECYFVWLVVSAHSAFVARQSLLICLSDNSCHGLFRRQAGQPSKTRRHAKCKKISVLCVSVRKLEITTSCGGMYLKRRAWKMCEGDKVGTTSWYNTLPSRSMLAVSFHASISCSYLHLPTIVHFLQR